MIAAVVIQQQRAHAASAVWDDDPLHDTDYEGFCRSESIRRGIDPDVAVIVCNREGGLTEPARLGDFSGPPWYSGKSWWALQLHYGADGPEPWQNYWAWGNTAGMGNAFTATTNWAPGDPRAWRDAMRYALDAARAGGWGPWYGAAAAGITGFHGINRRTLWDGTPADQWDYVTRTHPSASQYVFPVAGYEGDIALHWGVYAGASDIFAEKGTPVLVMRSGYVVYREAWGVTGGNAVQIAGDDGLQYYYAHGDDAPNVEYGQWVAAGTRLFGVGDTGNAIGKPAHLHIGIGETIMQGSGPYGGAGSNYDAVALLRRVRSA